MTTYLSINGPLAGLRETADSTEMTLLTGMNSVLAPHNHYSLMYQTTLLMCFQHGSPQHENLCVYSWKELEAFASGACFVFQCQKLCIRVARCYKNVLRRKHSRESQCLCHCRFGRNYQDWQSSHGHLNTNSGRGFSSRQQAGSNGRENGSFIKRHRERNALVLLTENSLRCKRLQRRKVFVSSFQGHATISR